MPLLRAESEDHPRSAWLHYRLAWALDGLGRPDSALAHARAAWDLDPTRERYLSELMKALAMLGRGDEVLALAGFVRGGGAARYYAASAGDGASLEYLLRTASADDDSAAADACCWLSVLASGDRAADSSIALLRRCVSLEPGDPFYRCMLVERLADAGRTDEAVLNLEVLRRERRRDPAYWQAAAAVAGALGDDLLRTWALRRCWQSRQTAAASRELAWGLYSGARRALSRGDSGLAEQWLTEAGRLGGDSAVTASCESLLVLMGEFESRAAGW